MQRPGHTGRKALAQKKASSSLGPLWVEQPDQDQSATLDILEKYCPGGALRWHEPLPRTSKDSPDHLMSLLARPAILLLCPSWHTYVLCWIEPMNGSRIFRPKIPSLLLAHQVCVRGDSCCPLAHALLEFATPAQLLSDMIHYVCFSENPKPGKLARTHWEA